ncbi:uncharacterized protein LOC129613981 [Condylostylus longicornis]|uniref:uncharacterized protein LOC129613981 n=1 Tax=Condylostylus longicornis TaxID=2530218 RepID=UPI00244DAB7E|nr:uncharacterized protein LOC129613981 [Condylostylus longicornis]
MFGLWYLSLAIDELRKYLGLSSIFDYFKGTKTASNKAIEDKKPSTDNKNQVPQTKPVLKPAPEPPKPVVEPPKPVLKPAPEPPKPVVEPPRPAPAPPKPIVEPPRPAPEPPKPIVEPPRPAPEPPKPSPVPITPPPQKSSSPPKPSTPKQITPPPAPIQTNVTPKKEPSPPQPKSSPSPSPSSTPTKNDNLNNFDRNNMFGPSKKLENGDTDLKSNIKDATTSFLQEEGRQGPPKSQQQSMQPSNINFKQL